MEYGLEFYKGRKVLVTGHTGFKGSWLCKLLVMAGAHVAGYALPAEGTPNLFELCGIEKDMVSITGDIRDLKSLKMAFAQIKPEIVIHMAAQPLVRKSYENPVYTYETNVMGTVNVLECVRQTPSVKSVVNVTTDKVYLNREWEWGYREEDTLNGYDPYSNSKSCSELVTSSYIKSFFESGKVAISTCRAGNVIGGGDFAADRIVPDCVRAAIEKRDIIVRNPYSVRPYEHVLEPVTVYLLIAKAQRQDPTLSGCYNIGPDDVDCRTTGELAMLFCDKWNQASSDTVRWFSQYDGGPHEAGFLKLDCSRLKRVFGWKPRWNMETAMEQVVAWVRAYMGKEDVAVCMERQIREFLQTEKL